MSKKLMADKANCTFWWRIHMNPNHPDVKSTVKVIDGYSKFVLHNEAKNKEDVLMAKIEMLWKNGYIKKAISIDIYTKTGPLPSVNDDKHILTLMPNDYLIHEKYYDKMPWRVKQFLINFYDCIKKGREVKFIRPLETKPQETNKNPDDLFDINKHNFKNYSELYYFAEKQKSLGQAKGLVDSFVQKYISQRLDNKQNELYHNLMQQVAKNLTKK